MLDGKSADLTATVTRLGQVVDTFQPEAWLDDESLTFVHENILKKDKHVVAVDDTGISVNQDLWIARPDAAEYLLKDPSIDVTEWIPDFSRRKFMVFPVHSTDPTLTPSTSAIAALKKEYSLLIWDRSKVVLREWPLQWNDVSTAHVKPPKRLAGDIEPDCEWMFADAGGGVVGFQALAHLNPFRWSGPVSFEKALQDLGEVCQTDDRNRPILVKVPANCRDRDSRNFDTVQEAIDFLNAEDPQRQRPTQLYVGSFTLYDPAGTPALVRRSAERFAERLTGRGEILRHGPCAQQLRPYDSGMYIIIYLENLLVAASKAAPADRDANLFASLETMTLEQVDERRAALLKMCQRLVKMLMQQREERKQHEKGRDPRWDFGIGCGRCVTCSRLCMKRGDAGSKDIFCRTHFLERLSTDHIFAISN